MSCPEPICSPGIEPGPTGRLCPTDPCPNIDPCPGIACCPEDPFGYRIPAHGFYSSEQCFTAPSQTACHGCKVVIPPGAFFSDVSQEDADAQALASAQAQAEACAAPTTYFNTQQCVVCPTIDNGSDPVLGPPYPPFFYQAFATKNPNNTVRLTWTMPTLIIDITTTALPGHSTTYDIFITNYSWPAWDVGTPYIQNQKVTYAGDRYYALVANTGKQPDISSEWDLDPTFFKLWWFDTDTGLYTLIGNSDNTIPPAVWNWSLLRFELGLVDHVPPRQFAFYITAQSVPGLVGLVYSNQFGIFA